MEMLSLETLPLFDGGSMSVLVNRALRDAYLDLDDRPGMKKDRRVTIEIALRPRDVEGQDLESVECEMQVKLSIPNKGSRVNILSNQRAEGNLGFEPDTRRAKHHKDQTVMPFQDPDDDGEEAE